MLLQKKEELTIMDLQINDTSTSEPKQTHLHNTNKAIGFSIANILNNDDGIEHRIGLLKTSPKSVSVDIEKSTEFNLTTATAQVFQNKNDELAKYFSESKIVDENRFGEKLKEDTEKDFELNNYDEAHEMRSKSFNDSFSSDARPVKLSFPSTTNQQARSYLGEYCCLHIEII